MFVLNYPPYVFTENEASLIDIDQFEQSLNVNLRNLVFWVFEELSDPKCKLFLCHETVEIEIETAESVLSCEVFLSDSIC